MVFRHDLISHLKTPSFSSIRPSCRKKGRSAGSKNRVFHGLLTTRQNVPRTILTTMGSTNHGKNVFYRTVNPSHVVEKLEWDIRNCSWSWFDHISRRNLKFLTCWVMLDRILIAKLYTLPETNSSHLKRFHPKRKLVFQPSIFRCKLLVSGSVIVAE